MSMADDQTYPARTQLAERSIQREAGDGNSKWADEDFDSNSLYEDNDGSDARTTFFHWDSDLPNGANRDKWKRLAQLNYGKRSKDSSHRVWKAGKRNDAKLFCDHLDFDQKKTDKVIEMAESIDFDHFGNYTVEQVLVAGCSLVNDRAADNFEDRIITRDEYKELMDITDMGTRDYRHIRNSIRQRTDHF